MSESEKAMMQYWTMMLILLAIGIAAVLLLSSKKTQDLRMQAIEFRLKKLEESK